MLNINITPELVERQIALEKDQATEGAKQYQDKLMKAYTKGEDLTSFSAEARLLRYGVEPVASALRSWLMDLKGAGVMAKYKKVLSQLDPYVLAFTTVKAAINSMAKSHNKDRSYITTVSNTLGRDVQFLLEQDAFEKSSPDFYAQMAQRVAKDGTHEGYTRTVMDFCRRKAEVPSLGWTNDVRVKIGSRLLDIVCTVGDIFEKIRVKDPVSKKIHIALSPTARTCEWLDKEHKSSALNSPLIYPMVVPPKHWDSLYGGGYLSQLGTRAQCLIATRSTKHREKLQDGGLTSFYRVVNALQDTAWEINPHILDALKKCKELGDGTGDIPMMDKQKLFDAFDYANPCPWSNPEELEIMKESSPEVVKKFKQGISKEVHEPWNTQRSQRMAVMRQIEMAEKFKDGPIWFPWYSDWRGRLYCTVSYLNPQGDHTAKALLQFAEGKRLGTEGARWLAIHGANLFGKHDGVALDKLPFEDRVAWIKAHEADIRDSAEHTWDGSMFWSTADESPLQFLAFCHEWTKYLDEGPDMLTKLPTAWDGSCNGLQHCSAVLCDPVGGKATNLVPTDRPQDIYAEVAEVAKRLLEYDAKHGEIKKTIVKDPQGQPREHISDVPAMAKAWLPHMDRSLVKRNVMTLPYGAKQYGMTDQLAEHVKKEGIDIGTNKIKTYCGYLAQINVKAIQQVVVKAAELMTWLQDTASAAGKKDVALEWTTPMGFHVLQHYPNIKMRRVKTLFGGCAIKLTLQEEAPGVLTRRAANGIVPNFIHSMDACHLQMTVLACLEEGIDSFAMIHDSFGCHACDAGRMNAILREQFVSLYQSSPLVDLVEQFKRLSDKVEWTEPPAPASLDLELVKDSAYCFA
jgi:DNA-directed RNA polymerase